MAAENMTVTLKVDTTALEAAMRKAAAAMADFGNATRRTAFAARRIGRTHARAWYTDGDRHIERIIGEILAGVPGRDPAIRLLAASDLAQVLDGSVG